MGISFSNSTILPSLHLHDQTNSLSGFDAGFLLFVRLYVFFGVRRLDSATHFVYFISLAGQERSGAAPLFKFRRNEESISLGSFLSLDIPDAAIKTDAILFGLGQPL